VVADEVRKKKMRQFGKVDIPQEAFIAALRMDED
jgi:GTP-binding protein LepA